MTDEQSEFCPSCETDVRSWSKDCSDTWHKGERAFQAVTGWVPDAKIDRQDEVPFLVTDAKIDRQEEEDQFFGLSELPDIPQITVNEHSFRVQGGTIVTTVRFIPDVR